MSQSHPSDQDLVRWTLSGKGHHAERHALHCAFCEQRLEALTELAPETAAGLAAALTPSSGLLDRLTEHLRQRLVNQETLAVLTDLLEVGPETTRLLVKPGQEEDGNG